MSFYERVAARPGGRRGLAVARLTRAVSVQMHTAAYEAGISPKEARRGLTRRQRRALKNVSATAGALAAFLHACGFELTIALVPAGRPRADVLARRAAARTTQQATDEATEGE